MARYVYNATLVQNTIDTLHAAVDSLETTDETVEKGIEMIMYANGAEVMDIDFSQIINYHTQVVEYIDAMTNELRRKAQEIEEYQNAPWYKKVFSTIGLAALKLIEGLGSFVENIGDGVVAITGFVGGIFSSEFKDACGEAIKKDIVGDAFENAYTNGWLKDVNKYSAMSHESTCANVFKGFGVAAGYVAISLVTGGSSLAVEIGVEAGLAGITGIGAGTQAGLQAGKTYNQAFAQGVKTGVVAAAGEAVMGYGINKLMRVKEVQEVLGSAAASISKAKTKVASIFKSSADDFASALNKADNVVVYPGGLKQTAAMAEYIEETSIFKSNGAKSFFRRADNIGDAMSSRPAMTELQQQWVDYINYNTRMGNRVTATFNSTTEISSEMLSKIDDLSQVDIQLLDGLGDGAGALKAKYQHPKYVQRVTYSGHEMNAIINKLEDLQSKIDMSLPPSQRAKQIYDILGSEVPVMHDYNVIPNGHEISASLRGLTPVNSAGKEGLVCAGYSSAYKELCERAGIPCDYVRGSTISDPLKGNASSNHAWNVVHTEVGDIPVDVTWNACSNGANNWFGASEQFSLKHYADVDEVCRDYSSMVSKYNFEPAGTKLDNVVSTLEQKYGSRQEALSRLEQYVSTGDANVITRTNDARNMILTTESADVQNYVYYARQNDNIQQIVDTMNYKYGNSSSGYRGLREYVNTGNPNCITRTNGARDALDTLDVDWLNQYLTAMGW